MRLLRPFGRVGSRAAHWLRGVSRRLHGTYGYLACLGEPWVTKEDAALFITKLPKAEHDAEEWQAPMQALLLVAEHDGPTMFARIGVMQAINRHGERVFDPSRKDKHWGRSKLARDRWRKPLPSHSHVSEIFFSLNYLLFLY
jgi:hypothetical protein